MPVGNCPVLGMKLAKYIVMVLTSKIQRIGPVICFLRLRWGAMEEANIQMKIIGNIFWDS